MLPLPDSSIDRLLIVHALEMANDPAELLKEAWRVLSPGGRVLAVVPNRRGLWARVDTSPFGYGRPFSRGQITKLLRETSFSPTAWDEALYVMPVPRRHFMHASARWEAIGARLWPAFAGVILVEAAKHLHQGCAGHPSRPLAGHPAGAAALAGRTAEPASQLIGGCSSGRRATEETPPARRERSRRSMAG